MQPRHNQKLGFKFFYIFCAFRQILVDPFSGGGEENERRR